MGPIGDPRLQEAYDYWRHKAASRGMPSRLDIDPTEMPRLLPHLMLVDVMPARQYRYRLIGTEIAAAQGLNATGRYVHEMLKDDDYRAYVLDLYDAIVRERRAIYTESIFLSARQGATERNTKRLMLPLSSDGETVNMVLVVQVFFYLSQIARNRHFLDARPHEETARAVL